MLIPNVPIADYVTDRFDGPPSLNSGLAHLLLTRSPLHAWHGHPRLNPAWQPDEGRGYDLGAAAHALLLEGRELFVIEAPDYRSKQAQAIRDEAKAAGQLPVLAHQASDIASMVTVARRAMQSPDLDGIGPLVAEQTILWEQDGVRLRCRPDWMTDHPAHATIVSYKTTRASAEPNAFLRTILGSHYAMQAAFELAGYKAAVAPGHSAPMGCDAAYVWLVQEIEPPFACSLLGLAPSFLAFAESRFRTAVHIWADCLRRDSWPSYPERIAYLEPPPWAVGDWNERLTLSGANEAEEGIEAL